MRAMKGKAPAKRHGLPAITHSQSENRAPETKCAFERKNGQSDATTLAGNRPEPQRTRGESDKRHKSGASVVCRQQADASHHSPGAVGGSSEQQRVRVGSRILRKATGGGGVADMDSPSERLRTLAVMSPVPTTASYDFEETSTNLDESANVGNPAITVQQCDDHHGRAECGDGQLVGELASLSISDSPNVGSDCSLNSVRSDELSASQGNLLSPSPPIYRRRVQSKMVALYTLHALTASRSEGSVVDAVDSDATLQAANLAPRSLGYDLQTVAPLINRSEPCSPTSFTDTNPLISARNSPSSSKAHSPAILKGQANPLQRETIGSAVSGYASGAHTAVLTTTQKIGPVEGATKGSRIEKNGKQGVSLPKINTKN